MIRVRLFTDEEWMDTYRPDKKQEYFVDDAKSYFKTRLLDTSYEDEPRIPFRDAESLQFLKETYDITFVSDEDWYSVMCQGSRSDISCLWSEVQFGLAAIDLSRRGEYTWFERANSKIWDALANLPFDIRIARRMSEMGIFASHMEGIEYVIENYPYKGQPIEVHIKTNISGDDFYTHVPEYQELNTTHGLCTGKDGKHYSEERAIPYAFQYYWQNDIEGIIRKIERMHKDRIAMTDTTRIFNIFELGELIDRYRSRNSIMHLDYLDQMSENEEDGNCSSCSEPQLKECYDEYLYFRDTFRVISHLVFAPEMCCRRLPMMMVDKNYDGTYLIHGGLTVKNPVFSELFYDVIEERSAKRERFVLILDVEELLENVNDIERAVCGFKVLADSVEVYDSYEGTQLFGRLLKEAYDASCSR